MHMKHTGAASAALGFFMLGVLSRSDVDLTNLATCVCVGDDHLPSGSLVQQVAD